LIAKVQKILSLKTLKQGTVW